MDTRNSKTKRCVYQLTLNAKLGDFSLESPQKLQLTKRCENEYVITIVKQIPKSVNVLMNGGPSTFKPLSKQSTYIYDTKK